ncbi:MAG: NAD(P)H-dependent oxidoreductase [Phycisphaerales bacterium]
MRPYCGAMPTVLLNLFHPDYENSRANRALIDAVRTLPNVTLRDHHALYPDGCIDVDAEQALLEAHDVHVMQFPFYWFSSPPLFKAWQDQILTWGWAFGDRRALEGKAWRVVTTLGGGPDDYSPLGLAGHTVDEILLPVKLTASYCAIQWLDPFCVYNVAPGSPRAITDDQLAQRARAYHDLLSA